MNYLLKKNNKYKQSMLLLLRKIVLLFFNKLIIINIIRIHLVLNRIHHSFNYLEFIKKN